MSYVKDADDIARLEQKWLARGRPHPYATNTTLHAVAGSANAFGDYLACIAAEHYDFGDTPNYIYITGISIEDMSANAVYLLELCKFDGDSTYTSIGAVRFSRSSPQTRSFVIPFPCREVNNDTHSIVAKLKSSSGAATVNFSLQVMRHLPVTATVPASTGTFPTG